MATQPAGGQPPPKLDRKLMEKLMFGTGRVRRFTQDSPVLPDVWIEYAQGDGDDGQDDRQGAFPAVKLLLTPYREANAGDVRRELRQRLDRERQTPEWQAFGPPDPKRPRAVYNQSTVAAELYFEDLIRVVLPMTAWWDRLDDQFKIEGVQSPEIQTRLAQALQDPEHPPLFPTGEKGKERRPPPELLWMMRVAGALALVRRGQPLPQQVELPKGFVSATVETWTPADWQLLVQAIAELIRGVKAGDPKARIYAVSRNREVTASISRSVLAVKADAARLLFNISCRELAWAIIDSGIDACHPAFRQRLTPKDATDAKEVPYEHPFQNEKGEADNCTRVVETYDFSQIHLLLDPDTKEQPDQLKERMRTEEAAALQEELETLEEALARGRTLDWKLIAPLLQVPHQEGKYKRPVNDHGTHVAGILAGDWRGSESQGMLEEDLKGVCPDLRLYDLRVLDEKGRGDEFSVMAALQFIRYLNSANDFVSVHGVNLSLSIPHDVSNYACGRTPVCEECERVVSSGIVVVAAAGNQGYRKFTTPEGDATDVYNSISITDPGNADLVITVGATHRYRPHTYGVSFFSSRGPTGDGRSKPDLVAPGEKITAPLPNDLFGLKDGTSMAAPHVSGAAALLMARHNELVGRPVRIKQILCATATDLGREKYFQGAGMLDTLRALQSV
jgi:hypothetical protein